MRSRHSRGFTLLEVLITTMIFMLAAGAILAQLSQLALISGKLESRMDKITALKNMAATLPHLSLKNARTEIRDKQLMMTLQKLQNRELIDDTPELTVQNFDPSGEISISRAYAPGQLFILSSPETVPLKIQILHRLAPQTGPLDGSPQQP